MSIGRFAFSGLVIGTILFNVGSQINKSDENPVETTGEIEENTYNVTSTLFAIIGMTLIGVSFTVPILHSHIRELQLEVVFALYYTTLH